MKVLLAVAYAASILAANWTLNEWGMVPLLGFGALVPAGLYWAGLSFGLRDALHEAAGAAWTVAMILVGAGLSALIDPAFALASGVAFLLSELLDLAVYSPLRERRWVVAVAASNAAGAVADSLIFLTLAFGWTAAVNGWWPLTVGKAVMILPALLIVAGVRRHRDSALEAEAA